MAINNVIQKYNDLLIKFSDNNDFIELLTTAQMYYSICEVENGNMNIRNNVKNPFDRLLLDLLLLQDEMKKGE